MVQNLGSEAREALEDIKRRYLAEEISSEEARRSDELWRRRLIAAEGFPHPPGRGPTPST